MSIYVQIAAAKDYPEKCRTRAKQLHLMIGILQYLQ